MNDGRFDKANQKRQARSAARRTRESLMDQLKEAETLEQVKDVLERLIKWTVK